jgi:hypothetical protein
MRASLVLLSVLLATGILSGCTARPDTRLVSDEKTCADMGHAPGSEVFKQCLAELNERRCRIEKNRYGSAHHVDSRDCTRLPN